MKPLLTLVALALASNTLAAEGWQQLPPVPEPNGGFIYGEQDEKVVVLGGTNWRDGVKRWLASVHVFDPQTMRWEKRAPLSDPIAYAVSGKVDGRLVWAGGTNGQRSVRAVATLGSRVSADALPAELVLSAGGVIGESALIVSGTDDAAELARLTRATLAVNVKTGAIEKLPDFPGQPTGVAASAVLGGQLFVFGGAHWNGGVVNTTDAFTFTLATREWRKLAPLPFAVRGMTVIALDDRRLYLAGGYKSDADGFTDEAFFYDVQADRYTPAPRLPYRAMVALVKCGEFLYAFGGEDRQKSRTDQCWRIRVAELLPR